ncbi:MAG TPA: hypothetical protein PKY12_11970, partial [Catalimonadaceae bacterium]|nr:hypothetical protein [Catalimonadaceae bacterium]
MVRLRSQIPIPSGTRISGLFLGLIFLFYGCGPEREDQEGKQKEPSSADSLYFSKESFSPLKLDSLQLVHYLDTTGANNLEKESILLFYKKRNFQFAWLDKGNLSPAAQDFLLRYQDFISDYSDSSLVNPQLDTLLYRLASDGPEVQQRSF